MYHRIVLNLFYSLCVGLTHPPPPPFPNSESLLRLLEEILRGSFSHEKRVGNIFLMACFVLLNLSLQKKKKKITEELQFSESTEQITHAHPRS